MFEAAWIHFLSDVFIAVAVVVKLPNVNVTLFSKRDDSREKRA